MRQLLVLLLAIVITSCSGSEQVVSEETGEGTWISLFDGTSTDGWEMTGPGSFTLEGDRQSPVRRRNGIVLL